MKKDPFIMKEFNKAVFHDALDIERYPVVGVRQVYLIIRKAHEKGTQKFLPRIFYVRKKCSCDPTTDFEHTLLTVRSCFSQGIGPVAE